MVIYYLASIDLWQYHEAQYTIEEYEEMMKASKAGD